jgi:membrane-associated phospholipid phosphatase
MARSLPKVPDGFGCSSCKITRSAWAAIQRDAHAINGLVTVPSFHACAATLLAWGFHRTPMLRWPLLGLNGLMLLSAIPIGGHYVTDVAAGFLVAVGAITISGKL